MNNILCTSINSVSKASKNFYVLITLLICGVCYVNAQSFPVQVIPQAIPPAPIHFSEYADASTTNSPLRVQVILNDLSISNREVRLRVSFEGNGIAFQSNEIVSGATPLFLEGGIPLVLTNSELAPYFKFENITGVSPSVYGQPIPEGTYQFCFEVIDVLSGNRLSQKSCATAIVFQNEPPFLLFPENRTNVEERNPQNIVFQWTPRHINVSNVEYELSLVEIWDNYVDPQAAFLSSPPIFTTTTTATTYVYGPSDPQLLSNKNYAWRIQAKAKQGIEEIGVFKNQGFSEIYMFSYAIPCHAPQAITHEVKGTHQANIMWEDFSTDVPEFTVRYRQKNGNAETTWFKSRTTSNWLTIWDLKPGATYEYQVNTTCGVSESDWSFTKTFTTFIADSEAGLYECGISPEINLTNKEPLPQLQKNDVFKAGDFPVKVVEVSGSNGRFTGKGYVSIPYLENIRVAVEFTNVLVNTDKALAEGTVVTKYDPSMKNILDIDEVLETVTDAYDAVADLGSSVEDILKDVFNDDDADEENAPNEVEFNEEEAVQIDTNENSSVQPDANPIQSGNLETSEIIADGDSSSNEVNSEQGNNGNSETNTTASEEEVVIVYNGQEYRDKEEIIAPYEPDNPHFAFLLKNYPENAEFKWKVTLNGTDYTPKYAVNEPIYDNFGIDMQNSLLLGVVCAYNGKEISVTVKRQLPEWDLTELYIKPENQPKRMAKSGQKLYLRKSPTPFVKDKRKIDASITLSPGLSKKYISAQDLSWYYPTEQEESRFGKNHGKKDIHLTITEQEEPFVIRVEGGNPIELNKEIEIVWFSSQQKTYNFLPPGVKHVLNDLYKKIHDNVKILKKYIPSKNEYIKISPLQYSGTSFMEEDTNTRHYKYIERAKLGGSITLSSNRIPIPTLPVLTALSRANVMDLGLYAQLSASITAGAGVDRYRLSEHTNFQNDKPFLTIGSSGCIEIGLQAKLLVAKTLVDFDAKGYAKGCLAGNISYSFNSKIMKGELYIPPVVLGASVKLKTRGKLEFELVDWSSSVTVTDKIELGKIERQF